MTHLLKVLLIAALILSTAGCYHMVQFDKTGGAHWTATPEGIPR